jgi:hypothetical protein
MSLPATVLVLVAVARAQPQPTAAEQVALRAGEIVVREAPARKAGAIRVEAFVDVAASPDRAWAALTDYAARVRGSSSLEGHEVYRPDPVTPCIRWWGGRFGVEVTFHNCYTLAQDRRTLSYTLDPDPARPSDMLYSVGTYVLEAIASGTRLTYEGETQFKRAAPGFAQRWLVEGGTREYMEDLRTRSK